MKPTLGILLGDANGIGPEIVAKLCARGRITAYCNPILIGDHRVLMMGQRIAGVDFPVSVIDHITETVPQGSLPLLDQKNLDPGQISIGTPDPVSGRATGDMLLTAFALCQEGSLVGFTIAPFNKASLQYGGHGSVAKGTTDEPYQEINIVSNLWTSRVTSHIPLKEVAAHLTVDKILDSITLLHRTMTLAGYSRPRIGVAALNPHAGEDGLCGREEIEIIAPAVLKAQEAEIDARGPLPADTIFLHAFNGEYDGVTTMYHDQGQIALKLMDFDSGVSVAAGLPFPITTPAHGTAFDIAGKGIAQTDAMERAIEIAARMAGWQTDQSVRTISRDQ
jgi:4-hydroxythreonine-4-phosphate dehydrogenase